METQNNNIFLHISSSSIVRTIFIILLFLAIFYLRDLVLAVLGAVVVASAIEPVTRWFTKKRIPRLPSVLIIYLGLALFVAIIIYFLIIPLLRESSDFLNTLPTYLNSIAVDGSGRVAGAQDYFQSSWRSLYLPEVVNKINTVLANVSEGFLSSASFIFGGLMSFVLIIVLSFYLSVQEDGVGKFLNMVSPVRYKKYVFSLWKRSEQKIGLWMQGQLLLMVIIAVLVYLGLTLLGVKHALLLAALAGVFELIPLFGPILAAVPAVAIAFLSGGVPLALLVVGLYLIIQQFENQLIYPLVVKKVVGVNPIIAIVALIAGVELAGFMGLLLSVPVAAVLIEFFNDMQHDVIHKEMNQ